MADSFKKILQSGLFTFHVGAEKTPYAVHAASIANQSRALDAMINGNFRGKATKTEILEDVDEDTFSRFCEFAYKGDYCPPVFEFEEDEVVTAGSDVRANGDRNPYTMEIPIGELDYAAEEVAYDEEAAADPPPPAAYEEEAAADPPPPAAYEEEAAADPPPAAEEAVADSSPAAEEWGWVSTQPKRKKGKGSVCFRQPSGPPSRPLSRRALFRQEFQERKYSTTQSIDATIEACKPIRNGSRNENYLPVFLGHAKLYVFADKYDIQPLKLLTLKKLHQTLTIFTLHAQRVKDIVGLVKFAYEHTAERAGSSAENTVDETVTEELRDLVVGYVVSELEKISGEEFDILIGEGGDFVVDFWHKVKDGVLESGEA